MANFDSLRQIAMKLPHVAEKPSYGTPAFYVKGKLFARRLEDEDLVVMKIEFNEREQRMMADPSAFFVSDHYLKHPMMIVRLSLVDDEGLEELLLGAWTHASN